MKQKHWEDSSRRQGCLGQEQQAGLWAVAEVCPGEQRYGQDSRTHHCLGVRSAGALPREAPCCRAASDGLTRGWTHARDRSPATSRPLGQSQPHQHLQSRHPVARDRFPAPPQLAARNRPAAAGTSGFRLGSSPSSPVRTTAPASSAAVPPAGGPSSALRTRCGRAAGRPGRCGSGAPPRGFRPTPCRTPGCWPGPRSSSAPPASSTGRPPRRSPPAAASRCPRGSPSPGRRARPHPPSRRPGASSGCRRSP